MDAATPTEPRHVAAQIFTTARAGYARHRQTDLDARLAALRTLKQEILDHRDEAIDAVMRDVGKCHTDALIAEIIGAVDWIHWLEGNATRLLAPQKVPTPITLLGKRSELWHEALGVVLVICPWNYPFHNAITAIAAAVACGNAIVYKPSEHAPCVGLIERFVGVSPLLNDLVHVAYGDGAMGRALIDAGPAKIFFTGSGATGARIMAQAAQQLIPVELELGGKDPMIVFDDAHTPRAVAGALWGAFTNAGQSCSAVERLLVHERIHDAFVDDLVREASRLVIGTDDRGDADIGRMTASFQRDKVIAHIEEALQLGARLRHGRIPDRDSLIVEPVILDHVTSQMRVWTDETFGPVLPVMRFGDEAEAIRLANGTDYGLCASVFSADQARARRVAAALEVGGVSINNVNMSEGNPGLPFGGAKKSGFGKLRGPEGLLGFTRSKAVLIDQGGAKIEANWYPYTDEKLRRFQRFVDALYGRGLWTRAFRLLAIAWHGLRLEAFSQRPRD
ncbi:aldehyde dehydrogenase family protein [Solimonas marina]|uniref:Aldehyde dehydrogenase n=1 Tax=Solimonas marina TaxID=2714601 RepID=A0A970B8K7_9GAMM|nr:aldehyde dehydrogenase family protein [Solimonas marina]NKF22374.1 aldehyde dehydrogenase family protein [Solimonas marina]